MPKETNPERLALLLRILRDPASNVVRMTRRAREGSQEPYDLGLNRLLPEIAPEGQHRRLCDALARFLERGRQPNRVDYVYEDQDPETIYEFRLAFHGFKVYVKTALKEAESDYPTLVVISVKRQLDA